MTYLKSGTKYICTLGLGSCGPRCGALYASEDGVRAHQRNMTHNSLNQA